ncbi:hypothetical protein Y032_0990g3308 [Ancylostoma ceylanicum]|uniref:Uncharacterized protein n=1 Tax=Ancylostoma ceylanicum TaxID=53326 RepID=A0A016W801_9BILA|nr:hypothetical protein Y032_0990g3308 [Ancylostoma ceylanicum]
MGIKAWSAQATYSQLRGLVKEVLLQPWFRATFPTQSAPSGCPPTTRVSCDLFDSALHSSFSLRPQLRGLVKEVLLQPWFCTTFSTESASPGCPPTTRVSCDLFDSALPGFNILPQLIFPATPAQRTCQGSASATVVLYDLFN